METETLKYRAERERGHVHRHIHCVFLSIVADDFNVPTLIPVPSIKFYCTKWMGWKDDKIRLRSKHRHFDVHNFQIQSWKQRTHFSTFERNWWGVDLQLPGFDCRIRILKSISLRAGEGGSAILRTARIPNSRTECVPLWTSVKCTFIMLIVESIALE